MHKATAIMHTRIMLVMKYTNVKEYVYFFDKVHQHVCKIFHTEKNQLKYYSGPYWLQIYVSFPNYNLKKNNLAFSKADAASMKEVKSLSFPAYTASPVFPHPVHL
jgi:hypothetical protein